MRNWHRGIMTVFGVVLTYWVSSGLIMAVYDATDSTQVWARQGGGPGARLNDAALDAAAIPPPNALAAGITAAQATLGNLAVASVDLRMIGSTARLEFADSSGNRDSMGRFYAETGAPMTQQDADGEGGRDPDYVVRRNTLKDWHRGNIAGMTGQVFGLLAGLSLAALGVSGVILYFKLWSARRATGRRGFFWQARESIWRRLHRSIAIVSAALVLNIAISGAILAFAEIQLNVFLQYHFGVAPYPRPTPLPPVSGGLLPHDVNAMLQTAYRAMLMRIPDARVVAVQLVVRDDIAKGLVTLGGGIPKTLAFDALSGVPLSDWATTGVQVGHGYFADWHQLLKRIHRGDIIGRFAGRFIDMAAGFALLYLVISSFVMYVDLLQRRRKTGRKGFFWR